MFYSRFLPIFGLILFGVASRLIPHPPNFTALNAIALFGVASFGSLRYSVWGVFAIMLFTDLLIGFHHTQFTVYLCYGAILLMGYWFNVKKSAGYATLLLIASSLLFFVVTNFAFWLSEPIYPKTCSGLALCYLAGLPFFVNQIMGDFTYGVLIWSWMMMRARFTAKEEIIRIIA